MERKELQDISGQVLRAIFIMEDNPNIMLNKIIELELQHRYVNPSAYQIKMVKEYIRMMVGIE